jgi:hypothetical protein
MPSIINVNGSANGNYNVNLNGNTYFLRTYWNEFANRWFLDFLDVKNTPLAMGCAIVSRKNLFNNNKELSLDVGEIWAFDVTGGDCETREALGVTTLLVYFKPGEIEAFFPNYNDQAYRPFNYKFDLFFTVAV